MKQALINGKIYIEKGTFEEAVLIDEDKILKTGSNGEILASAGADCKVYDCGGKTVLPGLNDSHLHLLQVGMMLNMAPILIGIRLLCCCRLWLWFLVCEF